MSKQRMLGNKAARGCSHPMGVRQGLGTVLGSNKQQYPMEAA